jgi:uncharacterized protein YidB (DUF937 family)
MSFIDDLKNKVFGGAGGGGTTIGALLQMFDNHPGGFSGLLQTFNEKGLSGVASSWIGTGANQPITAEQIEMVLGNEHIRAFAAKIGISPEQASAKIAEYLPQVVDKLTPDGQVPQGNVTDAGKELLKSLGGKKAA